MRLRDLLRAGLVGAGVSALLLVSLAGAAQAQDDSECPAGQPPGRLPGEPFAEGQDERGQYPIGECQLRLSESLGAQGATIQAAGNGFAPSSGVNLALNGDTIGAATAGANGGFNTDLVIPVDAAVGPGVITAEGTDASGGARVLSANFTVTEAGAGVVPAAAQADRSGISGMLPRTGAGIAALTATGAGFIAVGTAAVVAARRRRAYSQARTAG